MIEACKDEYPVALMCRQLDVSKSGFYAWCSRPESARSKENKVLVAEIKRLHDASRRTYGSPRIHADLEEEGFEVSRNRVARLMRENGIRARGKRRFRKTTDSDPDHRVAPNSLARNFEVEAPNKIWAGDITYLWTSEGWMYLAVFLDLFSRKVVGWALADHMRTDLVLEALLKALRDRLPGDDLMHHSDRGSQYASDDYRAALDAHRIECSMSRKANCLDNAVAESFFGTLKTELIHRRTWPTREAARFAIHEYIEVFYNRRRLHSRLGYTSPVQFEANFHAANAA